VSGSYPRCVLDVLGTCGSDNKMRVNDSSDDCVSKRLFGGKLSGKENFTAHLDSNCSRNPAGGRHCGMMSVFYSVSPISLIWTPGYRVEDRMSLTQFPLGASQDGKTYEWRASADSPLLVWDPENSGLVTSSAQLFGNHTFSKEWQNGYQALASLDTNSDAVLTDKELSNLSLWFDLNRDGISQSGEVSKLTANGVTRIYTKANDA